MVPGSRRSPRCWRCSNDADHDDERRPRADDHRGARRGVRAHGAVAQPRLADRREPEVARRRGARRHDEDARAGSPASDRPAHRGGGGEGRRRGDRHAVRHVGARQHLDGDLRVRNGRAACAVVIRRSGPHEAEAHLTVQRDACVAAFQHVFPSDLYPFPDEAVLRRWRESTGTTLVAEEDGRIVGLAAVDACWLGGFYVLPELWGSGIADELHDAALATVPDCPEIRLWTLEANHRARRFYEKRGWRPNGETRVVPFPPNPLDVGYTYIREEP